jgi:alkanesulfonate monooxygenase SsuD/methylene tetrahydromethanopterin reductase-like flavin-dependent oxidoreductase (luciferase family)
MDVGIGLPNAVTGTTREQLLEWARRADARGFSTLGTIDRLVYGNFEPLTALTAAAAVTERIGLTTAVALGPLRGNPAALAKQTKSIQALSGGRLTLGIGLGGREDDYEFAGVSLGERAERMDALLEALLESWADPKMGPPAERPRLLVGGAVDASYARAARFGDGWIAGGASPEEFAQARGKVEAAWAAAGREGKPRFAGLAYFSLGDAAEENANAYLRHYYAWLGEETAAYIAGTAAKDAETVKGYIAAYEGVGCDELILFPTSSDPGQVDLLADAAGL